MTIGEKIGIYAKQKNISLRQLAAESEINYSTLRSIVTRKSERVSAEYIRSLAAALEIPESALTEDVIISEAAPKSEAEMKLEATINAIVGLSEGQEKEDKIYLINDILEANSSLIRNIFNALNERNR